MATSKDNGYQAAQYGDQRVERGTGGETHQVAAEGAPRLTTQQGTVVSDDQNTLRAGERGPDALEDFHFREKIFHFDHERIPERVVHARGYGAHGYFENYEPLTDITRADLFSAAGLRTPVFVRFSTVAGSKGSSDLARDVRGFASSSTPGRATGTWSATTSRSSSSRTRSSSPTSIHAAKPEPDRGFPQAQTAHDNFWDFVSLMPESHAHADVDHVGPGHPALVPVHGGLRRPHLPAGQRRGQVDLRQVPLEAQAGPAVGGVERGGQDQRRRPRLPPPRPVGRDRRRRLPRVGARAAAVRRGLRRPVRLRRARPDQAHPRGGGPGPPGRPPGPRPGGGQLLRRDRAGRVLHPQRRPRHRLHQRPAAAGPQLLLPRHPAQAAGRPQLHPAAGQRAQVPVRALPAGRAHGDGQPAGAGSTTSPTPGTRPGPREDPAAGFRTFPDGHGDRPGPSGGCGRRASPTTTARRGSSSSARPRSSSGTSSTRSPSSSASATGAPSGPGWWPGCATSTTTWPARSPRASAWPSCPSRRPGPGARARPAAPHRR